MPIKRRLSKVRDHRITEEAIEAFESGDFTRLHRALGLRPWEPSPLPIGITPLGVHEGMPPQDHTLFSGAWPKAQEIQQHLIEAGASVPKAEKA